MASDREPTGGVNPKELVQCTECETVYAGAVTADRTIHPAGTDGSCACGNDEFRVLEAGDG